MNGLDVSHESDSGDYYCTGYYACHADPSNVIFFHSTDLETSVQIADEWVY